jgi:hypothetical protein
MFPHTSPRQKARRASPDASRRRGLRGADVGWFLPASAAGQKFSGSSSGDPTNQRQAYVNDRGTSQIYGGESPSPASDAEPASRLARCARVLPEVSPAIYR